MDSDYLSILLFNESQDIDSLISKIIANPIFEIFFILIIILIFIVILIKILNNREERMKHKKRQRNSRQSKEVNFHSRGAYGKGVDYTTTQTRTNLQNDSCENNERNECHEDACNSRKVKDAENKAPESSSEDIKDSPKDIVEPVIINRQKDVIQGAIMLTVKNGLFVEANPFGVCYYKTWTTNGKKLFEFVNNDRTKMAINNRSILIEPFCIKMEKSISPDEADMVETKIPGILSDDFTVIEKAKIIYK